MNEYLFIYPSQRQTILNEIENGFSICSLTSNEYYVYEKYDSQGNIIDSHIMNADELVTYNIKSMSGLIGSDSDYKGKLSIGLVVTQNANNSYHIFASARWDTNSVIGGENYPDAAGDDFFGITWGGDGELRSSNADASGFYYNGNEVSVSRANSDSYRGYCWQFLEKSSGVGSCMKTLDAELDLSKTYSANKGKETNVMCTYIHTYSKVNGTISFTAGYKSFAGGISLSATDKQWQIQCDVSGLSY